MNGSIACLLLAALVTAGCVQHRPIAGRDIQPGQVHAIVPHATTKGQILEWFGPPDRIESRKDGGEDYFYTYRGTIEKTTELIVVANKTTIEERKNLRVTLRDGVVAAVSYTNSVKPDENVTR